MIDTKAESESNPQATFWVGSVLIGLPAIPLILAWYFDEPTWLFAWVLLLIFGLAG